MNYMALRINLSTFAAMFARLKDKWKVGWFQFILIFTTFALGGSLCARAGSWLLQLLLDEKNWVYWVLYVPLITILWPMCVLLVSIPFGQFKFFTNYLKKMGKKMGLTKKDDSTSA
jgi:hypothetical protein